MSKEKNFQEQIEGRLDKLHKQGFVFNSLYFSKGSYKPDQRNIPVGNVIEFFNYNKQLLFSMTLPEDVIAIMCDSIVSFKLLDLHTLAMEDKLRHKMIYFFRYDSAMFEELKAELNCYCLEVTKEPKIAFSPKYMPKVYEQKDRKYTLATLPRISQHLKKQILKVADDIEKHQGYHFQINHGNKYRISTATILNLLSSPIMTVNERKVFESVSRAITNSTFVLDTSQTGMEFRVPYKTFKCGLKLSRSTETIPEMITSAFETFKYYGLIDDYSINNDLITFTASGLTQDLQQQNNQRQYGFYNKIPGTKKAPKLAAWLDYLWIILRFTRKNKKLQIALNTLLDKLDLMNLWDGHRIKQIAEWLNDLSRIGIEYGFLKDKGITFNNAIVQRLLKERNSLHEYVILHDVAQCDKDGKQNGRCTVHR